MKAKKETLKDLTIKEYNRKIKDLYKASILLIESGCYQEARVIIRKQMFFKQAKQDYLNNIK